MFGGNVQNAVIVGDHLYSTVPIMGMGVQFVVKIKMIKNRGKRIRCVEAE